MMKKLGLGILVVLGVKGAFAAETLVVGCDYFKALQDSAKSMVLSPENEYINSMAMKVKGTNKTYVFNAFRYDGSDEVLVSATEIRGNEACALEDQAAIVGGAPVEWSQLGNCPFKSARLLCTVDALED